MTRERRKIGGLMIVAAGAVTVLIMCCAGYLAARILMEAMLRVAYLG